MRYTNGDVYCNDDGIVVAGIHDLQHKYQVGDVRTWGNRIECYGDTYEEANGLRNLILTKLNGE